MEATRGVRERTKSPSASEQQCSVTKGGRRCSRVFVPGKSGAKGMCSMHYSRARKHDGDPGDPEPVKAGERKDAQVKVWTTPQNEERWKAAAELAGKGLSPWCEEQINAAIS